MECPHVPYLPRRHLVFPEMWHHKALKTVGFHHGGSVDDACTLSALRGAIQNLKNSGPETIYVYPSSFFLLSFSPPLFSLKKFRRFFLLQRNFLQVNTWSFLFLPYFFLSMSSSLVTVLDYAGSETSCSEIAPPPPKFK